MARCRSCGTQVGCGCQLTNGLCASCIRNGVKRIKEFFNKYL